jgi:hypothetical protein
VQSGCRAALVGALAAQLFSSLALAQVVVGTVGHSLTDEYQRPESTRQFGLDGFNWVEILSRTRASEVTFGAYDAVLDANAEPGGFAFNHAIGGAMVLNSNMQQQVEELADDVAAGEIDAVVIWIGENDFTVRRLRGESFELSDSSFQSFQSAFVGSLVSALDALIAAGATDILLARVGMTAPNRSDIALATDDTNAQLASAAAMRPQVTFFAPLSEIVSRFDAASSSVNVGGVSIFGSPAASSDLVDPPSGVTPTQCGFNNLTHLPGCPTVAYQSHMLQDDGAHLTTPMQGLVANAMLEALQARGFALTPLSDAEILAVSGVATPPSPSLDLRWRTLSSRCGASTGLCRVKGKLIVSNADATPSQATTLQFLLSSDASADSGDLVLASRSVPALGAGKTKKLKLKLTLPSGVTTTGKYVLVGTSTGSAFVQGPLN